MALKPYTRTDIGKTERFSMSNPYYNPYCRRGGPLPERGKRSPKSNPDKRNRDVADSRSKV